MLPIENQKSIFLMTFRWHIETRLYPETINGAIVQRRQRAESCHRGQGKLVDLNDGSRWEQAFHLAVENRRQEWCAFSLVVALRLDRA